MQTVDKAIASKEENTMNARKPRSKEPEIEEAPSEEVEPLAEESDSREESEAPRDEPKETRIMAKIPNSDEVAILYQFGNLDCLVRLVEGISQDFRESDDIYQNLSKVARRLLRGTIGKVDHWEDAEERSQAFNRVLTSSDVNARELAPAGFPNLSMNLREAAREWATRKDSAVQEAYLAEVKNRARSLREYLEQKCQGNAASVLDAFEILGAIFKDTLDVLKDSSVIASFPGAGNGPSRLKDWPYGGDDGGSVRYIDAIGNRLSTRNLLDAETAKLIQGGRFSSILQMAHHGQQVIELVLQDDWEQKKQLDKIAEEAFVWDRYYRDLNSQSAGDSATAVRPRVVA